jgi:hypothetical protein
VQGDQGVAIAAIAPGAGPDSVSASVRKIPQPVASHPGNVFLAGEELVIPLPKNAAGNAQTWKALDDRKQVIASGRCAAAAGPAFRLNLGKFSVGWYRIEFQSATGQVADWTSAAVLAPPVVPTPQNSPVCLDTASAWFARHYGVIARKEHQQYYASLAALARVSWVRDRTTWGELEPTPGKWAGETDYDTSAAAFAGHDLNVLQVFHSTPNWAIDAKLDGDKPGKRFPRDLRHEYRFCKAMAVRFKGRVAAWEPWNEANIEGFGGHTATEMCALQKAAYLGFKAGDPDLTVCWNVLAGAGSPAQTRSVLANEAWPYFDTYNIHTYSRPAQYLEQFSTAREAASGRPLWLSECGVHVPWKTERPWGDMTSEDDLNQARFVAKSFASSLHAGIQRHFFFILGNYLENQIQFGLLRHDHTPRPGYVALAAVGRLLAGAKSLGRVPPKDGSTCVYAFAAVLDGAAKDVLVAWSDKWLPWPGNTPSRIEALYDYLGRTIGTTLPATLQPEAVFVVLPAGGAKSLTLEPPVAVAPRRDGVASPIVLQLNEPHGTANLVSQAYMRKAGQASGFEVVVYNFADHPVKGVIRSEELPAGFHLEPASWQVAIEPMGRQTLAGQVTLPGTRRVLLSCDGKSNTVKLRGDFGRDGRPVLAFDNTVRLTEVTPAAIRPIVSALKPDAWKDNIVHGASMTHHPLAPNGMQFEMRFGKSDPWGYPAVTLAEDEVPADDLDGLALTIQVLEGKGTFRVQFIQNDGSSYLATIPISANVRTQQRAVCLFSDTSWGSWSKPDRGDKLQPSQIRKVLVGVNSKKDSKVSYVVSGLEWIRF